MNIPKSIAIVMRLKAAALHADPVGLRGSTSF
jgi:hypothetical protein